MGQMQILVRDGWTVAVTALYRARLPLHCLVGILQHGVGRHLWHVLPGEVSSAAGEQNIDADAQQEQLAPASMQIWTRFSKSTHRG